MIISHKHKFIFIKTRKTAGTSIEIALSSICGEKDIITPITPIDEEARKKLGFLQAQNYLIPIKNYSKSDIVSYLFKIRPQYYNHMPAVDVKSRIGAEIWNSYYKFTFDRNPFDKMVSLYYWRGGDKSFGNISDFLKSGVLKTIKSYDLYSIDKLVAVDKVYKFEEMDKAFEDISNKLNLSEPLKIPNYKAKSGHRKVKNYKDILDDESISIIKLAFAREIQLLNYQY